MNEATTSSSSFRSSRRIISVAVLIALILRIWAAWQLPVDFDEPVYIGAGVDFAEMLQKGDFRGILSYTENIEHPPLGKLLYASVIWAQQNPRPSELLFFSRLVSVSFGVLSVLILSIIEPIAGLLFAVQTLAVKYTSQAYLEAFPLFTSLLAMFAILRAKQARDQWFWISAFALGLSAAGKYSYFPILIPILYIFLWDKKIPWWNLFFFFGMAGLVFFLFDPALWLNPATSLTDSLLFHSNYSTGEHVQAVGYGWYQPFFWVARSWGAEWHPDVYFYIAIDGLIFLLGLAGIKKQWKERRWVVVWMVSNILLLIVWPTHWPQYTLVLIPAVCLSAASVIPEAYRWLRDQEEYWDWFKTMIPAPPRYFWVALILFIGLLFVGSILNVALVQINKMGWDQIDSENSPLPSNTVYEVVSMPDGGMVLATRGGAAILKKGISQDDEGWVIFTAQNSSLPDSNVLSAAVMNDETLWFGTRSGLAGYRNGAWQIFKKQEMGIDSDEIHALAIDSDNALWVGTRSGLAVYRSGRWESYGAEEFHLSSEFVLSLAVQKVQDQDWIWVGTQSGLARFEPATQNWEQFDGSGEIGSNAVSDLLIDHAGRVWAATLGDGLGVWNGNKFEFYRVSNSEIPSNTIRALAEVQDGVYWISTAEPTTVGGIVAQFSDGDWQIFEPLFTGYSGAEVVTIAPDVDGNIWFGSLTAGLDIYLARR